MPQAGPIPADPVSHLRVFPPFPDVPSVVDCGNAPQSEGSPMRPTVAILALAAALVAPALQAETRCGWYANPTPGNVILTDADDSWWLATQGMEPTPGLWEAYGADMDERSEWILNNGNYGYRCACAEGDFGPVGSSEAYVIRKLTPLPLSRCEADPALLPWVN